MKILANDPSFTAWGWAVIDTEKDKIVEVGCIKTAPEHKKRRIRAGDDKVRRTTEIAQAILAILDKHDIELILSELPHGSQNANAAVMMGVVMGVLVGISESSHIAIEYYSEQDAKKALLGRKSATKDATVKAIEQLYNVPWSWKGVKYHDEAVADAIAIYHVAKGQSTIIKWAKT